MEKQIERLNALADGEACAELLKCCGSRRWAQRVAAERPFQDAQALFEAADRVWWSLEAEDWLEAFRSHPKIGERKAAAGAVEQSRRWSEDEQSATRSAARSTLDALAEANEAYADRFGYIFIICATGKSTEEMLAALHERLSHDDATELRIAAEEQRRITHLRLRKLLEP